MRFIITTFLLIVLFCQGFSQTKEIDRYFERGESQKIDSLIKSGTLTGPDLLLTKANYFTFHAQLSQGFKSLSRIDTTTLNISQKAYYYNILAELHDQNVEYDLAVNYFQRAQKLHLKSGHQVLANKINLDLFYILLEGDFIGKYTNFLERYANTAHELNNSNQLASLQVEYAFNSLDSLSNQVFLDYFDKAFYYNSKDNNPLTLAMLNAYKAMFYTDIEYNKDSANAYLNKSLKQYQNLGLVDKEMLIYINYSEVERIDSQTNKAIRFLKQANQLRDLNYDYDLTAYNYELLANDYKSIGQYDSAYYYLEASMQYKDSLNIQKQNINLTRFQTERKEKQNLMLQQDNRQKQTQVYASLGAFAALLITSALMFVNFKRRQTIANQTILIQKEKSQKLLKEQELKAVDAMIKGQDLERKRFAADLHDQVGGNLASINAYFSVLKQQIKDKDQQKIFNTTFDLLSNTYEDIRALAHKNNSSTTVEKSLMQSLAELKNSMLQLHNIELDITASNTNTRLPNYLEISIYRIIQELVANTLKHADASKISINLTLYDSEISLIFEDNGQGFNPEKIHSTGMGLKNINNRIEELNGTLGIDSKPGKGATFIIHISYD